MPTELEILPFRRRLDMADERFAEVRQANERIFNTMHNALLDVVESDFSLEGAIAVKKIATDALLEVQKIAVSLS